MRVEVWGRCRHDRGHAAARPPAAGALLFAALLTFLLSAAPALAETLVVTSTADSGAGSLRAALAAAPAGATVSIPAPGDYIVSSAELPVQRDVTIEGSGAAVRLVADGAHRVLDVTAGAVTIRGLTVTGGGVSGAGAAGGGIANEAGRLILEHVIVTGNRVEANPSGGNPRGGGIANGSGILELTDSIVSGNSASVSPEGGGVAQGGGIANTSGAVTLLRTTVAQNTAAIVGSGGVPEGGGIGSVGGTLELTDSVVSANNVSGGAVPEGAGVFSLTTDTALERVTVSGNVASVGAGATLAEGGGLFASGGSLALRSSTIAVNTVSGGTASQGGGVELDETTLRAASSTIAANLASGPNGSGGNLMAREGAVFAPVETIVSGGTATLGPNCMFSSGALTRSAGHNLDSRSECGFAAAGDVLATDPLLAGLADNGGVAPTMAPAVGSRAIDGGAAGGCPAVDERGVLRPAGSACDIGAVELAVATAMTGTASGVGTATATVSGTASNPDVAPGGAHFEVGPTAAYGLQTTSVGAPAVTVGMAVTATLSGLQPGTVYHFRLVVANRVGTGFGADATFATAPLSSRGQVAPVLSGLSVSPTALRPERRRGPSISRAKGGRRGATVAYRDTRPAFATFTVQRAGIGFLKGGRCLSRRPAGHVRKPRRCPRYATVGRFGHIDAAGLVRFHFTGWVNRRRLRVGRYRLLASASASGSARGATVSAPFRVLR